MVDDLTPLGARRVFAGPEVGCVLAECFLRKALLPGRDYLHQIRLTTELLGKPHGLDLDWIENAQAL